MKFAGIRAMLPIAFAALALAASGCDKAKSLAEEAAGIKVLDDAEKQAILTAVGWDETKNPGLAVFKVHKAIELTDKFKGDLSKTVELPVPIDAPEQAQGTAEKQRSLAIVKKEEFKLDDATYTRLRIISIARVDAEASQIVIDGEKINQYIPANRQIKLDNNNQAGQYLLIEGKGEKGLAYLTGAVKFIADGGSEDSAVPVPDAVGDTFVFTSSSPFVTVAGDVASGGKYFLAMLEGSKGTVFAYNKSIGSTYTGTPATATKEMSYSGVLEEYKGAVDDKVGKLGNAEASTKSTALFDKANTAVSDFVNGWKLVVTELRFKQPTQAKPTPAAPPTPSPAKKPEPTPAAPADIPPKTDSPVVRKPDGEVIYNVDLGCNGFNDAGEDLPFVRTGALFDDYEKNPGWRATGSVGQDAHMAEEIFPSEGLGNNYLDGVAGYCWIATGDQLYFTSKSPIDLPGPDGAGQTSEMWQKVNVPADAKAIQMRVAFFSSEFPIYVGSSFNDSFFIKFDESTDLLAFGTLNDLAGGQEAAAACPSISTYAEGKSCGEWVFTKDKIGHGDLWDVRNSSQTPGDGENYKCVDGESTSEAAAGKCYHGMIASRIICKDLTANDQGKIRTLRFNVSDAGDAYYDSALAVDSVVFSKTACGDATGRMTPATIDPDSKARTVN